MRVGADRALEQRQGLVLDAGVDRRNAGGEGGIRVAGARLAELPPRFLDHRLSAASAGSVAAITAVTAARSASDRPGCQQSTMRITRRASEGFMASCSIVSSNTQAVPT